MPAARGALVLRPPGLTVSHASTRMAVVYAVATAAERAVIDKRDGVLLQTGIGSECARRGAARAIEGGATGLVSLGTAAGLKPGLATGTILLPQHILWSDGRVESTDPEWHQQVSGALTDRLAVETGALLAGDAVIFTPEEKRTLHRDTGAVGTDMETGALARAAAASGLPFLVIRVVLDRAEDAVPPAAATAIDARGEFALVRLAANLLRRPADIPGMIRLARRFPAAGRSLSAAYRLAEPLLRRAENPTAV